MLVVARKGNMLLLARLLWRAVGATFTAIGYVSSS
jgi:hypothetical protein